MICFELSRNGQKVCTGGVEKRMLIFHLDHHTTAEMLNFSMSGIVDHEVAARDHAKWADGLAQIGDQFMIRIIESPVCDLPQPSWLEKSNDSQSDDDRERDRNGGQ